MTQPVRDLKASVQHQFNQAAADYSTSPIHAQGADLGEMLKAAALDGSELLLDAGSGTGHTAHYFAPHVAQVIAYDLSAEMLAHGERLAHEKQLTNITFRQGDVEELPFPAASFDRVITRYSAHHWPHPTVALQEFKRVLKPTGLLLIADVVSWDDPTLDTHFQAIELLRDPSHVRDHTVHQWRAMVEAAGFQADLPHRWEIRIDFAAWIARMHTPAPQAEMIRTLFAGAPSEVSQAMQIGSDGSFTMQCALIRGLPIHTRAQE
jgi:ubiquinone/menaquinone biosynthesis C-methylase UbiE